MGIDPSGLEFSIIGLMSSLGSSLLNRGEDASASFNGLRTSYQLRKFVKVYQKVIKILDKIRDISEWVTDIYDLLDFDLDDANEVIAAVLKKGLNLETIASTLLTAAPGVHDAELDLPERFRRKFVRLAGKVFRLVGETKAQEIAGEMGTALVIYLMDFVQIPKGWSWSASDNGPDQVAKHYRVPNWGIFEAKGGNKRLGNTTQWGPQMGAVWLSHWIPVIYRGNSGSQARDLEDAFEDKDPRAEEKVSGTFYREYGRGKHVEKVPDTFSASLLLRCFRAVNGYLFSP